MSLWLFNTYAFAQRDSSRLLNPVPVFTQTDSVLRISVINSAIPHYILNEEKLAGLAVTDIGAAMKFIPGMQLKDYGGIGGIKTVSFRSLGSTHTGVTVDGIRVSNVQSGSINLSSFEIFGVNELGFTSGQTEETNVSASAYLQANSIAIKSQLAKQPEKLKWRLYSAASTISAFEQGALISTPLSKNLFFGFQAMTKSGQGDYSFVYEPAGIDTAQRRANSALFNYKLRSVVGVNLKNSQTLFSFSYSNNEQELPGAIILYNASNDQKLWNEDLRFSVLHDQRLKNWKLQLNAFYQSAYLRYFDPDFLNLQGFIDNSYLQQNEGTGAMIKRYFLKNRALFFSGTDAIFSQLTGSNLPGNPERIESNSVLGLNVFFKSLKLESNITLQAVSDKLGLTDTLIEKKFLQASPFLSLCWMPFRTEAFRIRSFYKRAFTLPTFNDLYYNFIGNTNLNPERAHLFNVGISYGKTIRNWVGEFSADGFYNRIQDKIVAIPTKDLFNWSMQNIGEIQATGIDAGFLISYRKKDWKMTVNGSYTFNLSLDITDSESTTFEKQIPYTPFHSGTAGLALSYKEFCLNLNGFYSGFRYSLNENIYANYLAPFTDLSVNLSKQITFAKVYKLKLGLAAMNLLNKNYEVIRSFPMPGRYYQFILNLNFR
ncbi:MAG: TonB-dependent receptor [Bacteroidetes bacterium]|nr:TonB-dependent receptor [Bacteroidota bacterium]